MAKDFWKAPVYDKNHAFVSKYGEHLVNLLSPIKNENILDVGCGTGDLSYQISESGAQVTGIDMSSNMVEQAKRKYPALSFHVLNVYDINQIAKYDAIFSNAVLHWVTNPKKALENFHRTLRPGGRMVIEFGGKGNVQKIREAIHAVYAKLFPSSALLKEPWYFPSLAEYTTLLEEVGFTVHYASYYNRPTPLKGEEGLRNWILQFSAGMLEGLSDKERNKLIHEVEKRLYPTLYQDDQWIADYYRLQVIAYKGRF